MRSDVAIYAVVRILVPQVSGQTNEEMILGALQKAPIFDLPAGADVVRYEVLKRRPGGLEEKEVFLDKDHLALLRIEDEAGARIFDLAQATEELLPEPPPGTTNSYPSSLVIVQ